MKRVNAQNRNTISAEEFEFRLKICIKWCKVIDVGKQNIRGTFRNTYEIADIIERLPSLNFAEECEFHKWTTDLHQIRLKSLEESLVSIKDVDTRTDLEGGRVLGHVRDENLDYGILEHETRGFFDSSDNPPTGLWLANIGNCLLSYVPASLVTMVDKVLYNLPDESVHWTDVRPEFIRDLKTSIRQIN